MKVLYLIDSLRGYGAEKSLVQIALHLERVTPIFVHLYKGDLLTTILKEKGIKVYSLNLRYDESHKNILDLIIPIVENENPLIIHSTLFKANMVARSIKKRFPEILLVGSFVSNSYSKNRYKQLDYLTRIKLFSTQLRDWMTINNVDYFVCNSRAIMKSNLKALGVSESKVRVIYRGRYIPESDRSIEPDNLLKQKLKLDNHTVFLNIGRLHKGKGQIELLYAFKKVTHYFPNLILLIAGEGSLRKELENLIKNLELEEKVFLLGYKEEVEKILALADFFVFPSFYEGLPGALIEAIFSKKPAIVSDIEENRECFPPNSALFSKPGDEEQLEEKMIEALKMKNWKEKTQQAYNYASKNFDVKKIGQEYEKFYFEIRKKLR